MRIFAVCLLASLAACTETQVLVHFTADEALADEASELRVRVAPSAQTDGQVRTLPLASLSFDGFPITQPVSPHLGESGRRFDVTGELLRADGTVIARQRASGAYVDGERSHVALHFSTACRETICTAAESCVLGTCESPCVVPTADPATPPTRTACDPLTTDAGMPDATGDSGGTCPGGCSVLEHCESGSCEPEAILSLSVGERTTCVILESERAVCWGRNSCGELGLAPSSNPTSSAATEPHDLGVRATAVECGLNHCCALSGGVVTCFGSNAVGQLARPEGTFSAPTSTCGTLESPVNDYSVTPVVVPTCDAFAIAVNGDYTCVLCEAGTVQCWGSNEAGQCAQAASQVVRAPLEVPGVAGAVQLVTGPFHACARLVDNRLTCWGFGSSGQLGRAEPVVIGAPAVVDSIESATDVWVGLQHTCALDALGTVSCWGAGETTLAGAEGEVLGEPLAREDQPAPRRVLGLEDVRQLGAGNGAHLCTATNAGTLQCWGAQGIRTNATLGADAPGHGELGRGPSSNESLDATTPANVDGGFSVADLEGDVIGCGRNHTCAVSSDGRVYCWGDDTYGQTSHRTIRRSPTLVRGYSL